ncbi:MAG: bifunctional UDP-N-acetylglucosamine diphosphorylase/glucosamine-1-phosphate N-acetyltransferase GlmU [Candidatus Sericytochromatia bacterium]|uniref:Bifunctional protein GlmU n=1 Tax=Candidatus Tanganyikabacteria bacterium TaxID=2961651 RepID=A0A937X8S0_9BACT|nr:bifunctional UDP-N-acetylglucosamine diphosphorylase/glucosamine-1-phosphate N-acetyltransferase GlmU [Candidatus Tanganyikabacteria bacterium]
MADGIVSLVMAAGKGTRMASDRPKVLHEIAGEPILGFVLAQLDDLRSRGILARAISIVGHGADEVRAYLSDSWPWTEAVEQAPQLGTGHAVMQAAPALTGFSGDVLIVNGDVPLLEASLIEALVDEHKARGARLTFLTCNHPRPHGLGRILRDGAGRVRAIVEHRDATPEQRDIREINVGVYLAHWPTLWDALGTIGTANDQGEYYLTDAIAKLVSGGHAIATVTTEDYVALGGINTRAELVATAAEWRVRRGAYWLSRQVTVEDPATAFIGPRVTIGPDTVVEPFVQLYGHSQVGSQCVIGSHTRLVDSLVGDSAIVRSSDIVSCEIGDRTTVGPFARLRDHAVVGRDARIGNFVELKKVNFGDGAKAAHLTYLGDAEVGDKANIGCGTVTCNYDGERKHRTTIGAGAFIGTNNTLVAPVEIGQDAYTGAGSTITEDVPAGALALGRAHQVVKEGWVARRRAMRAADKQRSEA